MELAMWLGDISEFTKPLDEPQKKEVDFDSSKSHLFAMKEPGHLI